MKSSEIARFLEENIEPLPDRRRGNRYRAAVHLIDGTFLPCVVFQDRQRYVELALQRFEQLRDQPDQYRGVVEAFVASGSMLDDHKISSVEMSRFAWPRSILQMIHGETTMDWTAFVVEFKDEKRFSYGTPYHFEFFELPNGYSFQDIKAIQSGMVHSDIEGTRPFSLELDQRTKYLREKPFFTCYLKDLDPVI